MLLVSIVVVVFPFILDVGLLDVPAGVTHVEGHTGFLIHLPSAVLALNFLARSFQPFLSLVDHEVEFLCTNTTNELIVLHLLVLCCWPFFFILFLFFARKIPARVTEPGFELTSQRELTN